MRSEVLAQEGSVWRQSERKVEKSNCEPLLSDDLGVDEVACVRATSSTSRSSDSSGSVEVVNANLLTKWPLGDNVGSNNKLRAPGRSRVSLTPCLGSNFGFGIGKSQVVGYEIWYR